PGPHWVSAVQRSNGTGAQAPFTVQTDWTQFRYDASHSGLNRFENVLSWRTVSGLSVYWIARGYVDNGINSSPAVANGMVYVGSADNKVYAISALGGDIHWTHTTDGDVNSSPAVLNGVVYVGSNDHKVYALRAENGGILWTATTGGEV